MILKFGQYFTSGVWSVLYIVCLKMVEFYMYIFCDHHLQSSMRIICQNIWSSNILLISLPYLELEHYLLNQSIILSKLFSPLLVLAFLCPRWGVWQGNLGHQAFNCGHLNNRDDYTRQKSPSY